MNKQEIKLQIAVHANEIGRLEQLLIDIDSSLQNNQYNSHEQAERTIIDQLIALATNECEGRHNCGSPEFFQQYQLIGSTDVFEATVTFEYNRHDKTYYYIDEVRYQYSKLENKQHDNN